MKNIYKLLHNLQSRVEILEKELLKKQSKRRDYFPITKQQAMCLDVIKGLVAIGVRPTLEEIRKLMGLKRVSSVQRHTEALKKKGIIIQDSYSTIEINKNYEI